MSQETRLLTPAEISAVTKPRIGVCIPSGDHWHADFGMSLCYMIGRSNAGGMNIGLANIKSYQPVLARNELVRGCMDAGLEWMLFLDTDMTFPPDTLVRLLASGKEIVGATYLRRVPPHGLLGVPTVRGGEMATSGLEEMDRMPTGVLLIRRTVFQKLPYPWFVTNLMVANGKPVLDAEKGLSVMTEDYFFSDLARQHGFKLWCDLDLTKQIGHISSRTIRWNPDMPGEVGDSRELIESS